VGRDAWDDRREHAAKLDIRRHHRQHPASTKAGLSPLVPPLIASERNASLIPRHIRRRTIKTSNSPGPKPAHSIDITLHRAAGPAWDRHRPPGQDRPRTGARVCRRPTHAASRWFAQAREKPSLTIPHAGWISPGAPIRPELERNPRGIPRADSW